MKNVFYSALPLKLGNCASYEELECPIYSKKDQLKKANYDQLKMANNKKRFMQTSFCVLTPLT